MEGKKDLKKVKSHDHHMTSWVMGFSKPGKVRKWGEGGQTWGNLREIGDTTLVGEATRSNSQSITNSLDLSIHVQ